MGPRLADAIGDYLRAHIERHGRKGTAEAFGVSRHTLWRFIERGRAGRALPRAVLQRVGPDLDAVDAATQALLARPIPAYEQPSRPGLPAEAPQGDAARPLRDAARNRLRVRQRHARAHLQPA